MKRLLTVLVILFSVAVFDSSTGLAQKSRSSAFDDFVPVTTLENGYFEGQDRSFKLRLKPNNTFLYQSGTNKGRGIFGTHVCSVTNTKTGKVQSRGQIFTFDGFECCYEASLQGRHLGLSHVWGKPDWMAMNNCPTRVLIDKTKWKHDKPNFRPYPRMVTPDPYFSD